MNTQKVFAIFGKGFCFYFKEKLFFCLTKVSLNDIITLIIDNISKSYDEEKYVILTFQRVVGGARQ